jgi:hypothetical protein
LHAKIYIADEKAAIISSANLTDSGMGIPEHGSKNAEVGIYLNDKEDVSKVREIFFEYYDDPDTLELDKHVFKRFEQEVDLRGKQYENLQNEEKKLAGGWNIYDQLKKMKLERDAQKGSEVPDNEPLSDSNVVEQSSSITTSSASTSVSILGKESEKDALRNTFMKVFSLSNCGKIDDKRVGNLGFHDGNQGVQWNVWFNKKDRIVFLGVNLEGNRLEGNRSGEWPISRFILNELNESRIFDYIKDIDEPEKIVLYLEKDAYMSGFRLKIRDEYFKPTPISLNNLKSSEWKQALSEAKKLLNVEKGYKGKTTQNVTSFNGKEMKAQVAPHIYFVKKLWYPKPQSELECIQLMQEGKDLLEPLYDFVAHGCRRKNS